MSSHSVDCRALAVERAHYDGAICLKLPKGRWNEECSTVLYFTLSLSILREAPFACNTVYDRWNGGMINPSTLEHYKLIKPDFLVWRHEAQLIVSIQQASTPVLCSFSAATAVVMVWGCCLEVWMLQNTNSYAASSSRLTSWEWYHSHDVSRLEDSA